MSAQSSVLAPGKQGRYENGRGRSLSATGLALAATAALAVALGSAAVIAGQTATGPAEAAPQVPPSTRVAPGPDGRMHLLRENSEYGVIWNEPESAIEYTVVPFAAH